MTWSVIWVARAENELTEHWLTSPQREAITKAADAIDLALRTDPLRAGRSRGGKKRSLAVQPLGVDYLVNEMSRTAYVLSVWLLSEYLSRNGEPV